MAGNKLLPGALAGVLGTAPMTVAMLGLAQVLPWYQKYALPPKQITDRVTKELGVRKHLNKPEFNLLVLVLHFLYGGLLGSIYALLLHSLQLPAALKGIIFGIAAWAISYNGWIPALGILPPAKQHPTARKALMIVAHIIWGATTGLFFKQLNNSRTHE